MRTLCWVSLLAPFSNISLLYGWHFVHSCCSPNFYIIIVCVMVIGDLWCYLDCVGLHKLCPHKTNLMNVLYLLTASLMEKVLVLWLEYKTSHSNSSNQSNPEQGPNSLQYCEAWQRWETFRRKSWSYQRSVHGV